MEEIKITVGRSNYFTYSKPDEKTAGIITKSIKNGEYGLTEIKKSILNGFSVRPAIFEEDRFISQQVFFVDVDNKAGKRQSIKQSIEICKEYDFAPFLVYSTFSFSGKKPNHRIVFALKEAVTDANERETIVKGLNKIFTGDEATENLKRIFYPGKILFFFNPFFSIKKEKMLEVCKDAL